MKNGQTKNSFKPVNREPTIQHSHRYWKPATLQLFIIAWMDRTGERHLWSQSRDITMQLAIVGE